MSIFSNCSIPKDQGNIGEARAIYEYTLQGFRVSKPFAENCPYDLIIEREGIFQAVSVKTTSQKNKSKQYDVSGYMVQLNTTGGNTKGITRKDADHTKYDLVFILADNNKCWSIPANVLENKKSILVDTPNSRYNQFVLNWSG